MDEKNSAGSPKQPTLGLQEKPERVEVIVPDVGNGATDGGQPDAPPSRDSHDKQDPPATVDSRSRSQKVLDFAKANVEYIKVLTLGATLTAGAGAVARHPDWPLGGFGLAFWPLAAGGAAIVSWGAMVYAGTIFPPPISGSRLWKARATMIFMLLVGLGISTGTAFWTAYALTHGG